MATQPTPLKGTEKLSSRWQWTEDLGGFDMPIRLEGEIGDVMVRGTIPDSIDGTFYRVAGDHFTPPLERHIPLDNHGTVSAFRIHKGQVDFKIRYVQNDRYKFERKKRQSFFVQIVGNPMQDHPCVRAVLQTTSNINVLYWAGKLHALNETGYAWTLDADTLETTGSNPYGNQVQGAATFTGHPKIDQNVDELVTWGFNEDSSELISYSISRDGEVKNLHRIKPRFSGPIHDACITENWLVFCQWPAEPNFEKGGVTMTWVSDRPAYFIVAPRRPEQPLAGSGWKPYEFRIYSHPTNSEIVHSGGAWEENGKVYIEGTWPKHPLFPFWDGLSRGKPEETVVDYVRFEIDTAQPDQAVLPDPVTLVDIPNEFPRIDERFYCKPHKYVFMNVFHSDPKEPLRRDHIFKSLNATAMLDKSTGELKVYSPGPNTRCQEPVFIPRSDDSPEGDGHIIFVVDRLDVNLSSVVIMDTKDFECPTAVIELPMRMRAQVHGNWVDARELSGRPLVANPV
ncbi:hypothetical protein INS49_009446 [Diaporthe citri]|uniref:uncharacterized protein n=1 Tax=Diaporthe citri TaxID=83186 RepID=UPI001C7EB0CE|nr:uncharacterized protein INS49_009446 [Diaporthe citri]KAG6361222.1 hypothetical protein INS49_009446 [Diaporthe citri]